MPDTTRSLSDLWRVTGGRRRPAPTAAPAITDGDGEEQAAARAADSLKDLRDALEALTSERVRHGSCDPVANVKLNQLGMALVAAARAGSVPMAAGTTGEIVAGASHVLAGNSAGEPPAEFSGIEVCGLEGGVRDLLAAVGAELALFAQGLGGHRAGDAAEHAATLLNGCAAVLTPSEVAHDGLAPR